MKIIEKTIHLLLETQPFYAHFFLNCEIQYDVKGVSTAAVGVTDRNIKMMFNTKFIENKTPQELSAIIEHEVLHILFEHVGACKKDLRLLPKVANIAMDCSINQFIQHLPEGCITLQSLSEMIETRLEPEQNWEYYYSKIMQSQKMQDAMEKAETLDQHDGWESETSIGGKDSAAKAIARATAETALKSAKGNAPLMVLKALDALRDEGKTPWQQILANFVSKAISCSTKNTRKKRNRRFGINQPGKVKKRELILGVCVDSSGSISDESYSMFMAEVSRISAYCNKVILVDADSEVQNVTALKKKQKPKMVRYGSGGTAYAPAILKCVEMKVDAIVYFGDMDSADVPQNPGIPFLWAIVGLQDPPGTFGGVLRM